MEGKVTHGNLAKKLEEDETVDISKTNKWMNLRLTAHVEGFITAAQEQDLSMKETQKRREKDQKKREQWIQDVGFVMNTLSQFTMCYIPVLC